uniref:Cyclin A n=1 Tax=Stichopus japonicus TaxID=307972 RepID=A0A6B9V1W0_STIJA|nr:cyclin A [Apostichopus japonicus]
MSFVSEEYPMYESTNLNHNSALQQTRKTKREETTIRGNGPQACKRPALGIITNNVGRVQPARAAKQATSSGRFNSNSENVPPSFDGCQKSNGFVFPGSSTDLGFTIHVDPIESRLGHSTNVNSQTENETSLLNPAVTALPRPPLTCLENVDIDLEPSPMVLDTSLTENQLHSQTDRETDRKDSIYEVSEYAEEIFQYLREAELRNRPKAGYMKKQPDITASMRCILVDWLVEVAEEYKLANETLYLAVSYIDRFLSHMSVLRAKLQLVGTASAFIAAKFEEIYPPELKEFVYITDDTYNSKQVLRMEHMILKVLSFDLAVPTINVFLPRYIKASDEGVDARLGDLTKYLAELSLQHFEFVKYLPSMVAASATCLARHTLHLHAWTPQLFHATTYQFEDIEDCVGELHHVFKEAPSFPQQAVRDKYKSQKYNNISLTTVREDVPTLCS